MSSQPLVSVIIPVRNGGDTIGETLSSLLRQSFGGFEAMVIDDGSTDNTENIVRNIPDPRIRFFPGSRGGPSRCRNFGVHHARGEYIAFLDADDIWSPEKLQLQVEAMSRKPGSGVVYSWTDYIDANGKFVCKGAHADYEGHVLAHLLLYDFIESGCSNVLIRKSILDELGGFDENLHLAEDWDLWLRIAKKYSFSVVPKTHVFYRLSMLARSSAEISELKKACLQVIDRHYQSAPPEISKMKSKSVRNLELYLVFRRIDNYLENRIFLSGVKMAWRALISNLFFRRLLRFCFVDPVYQISYFFRNLTAIGEKHDSD